MKNKIFGFFKCLLLAWVLLAVLTFIGTLLGDNGVWITNPIGSLKNKFFPPKAPATA
jgi:hypothetical protein